MEGAGEGAEVAVTGISGHSLVWGACGGMALQRAGPGAGALVGGIEGGGREALLVGGGREDKRKSLVGAGPLGGPLHSLPSVEACVGAEVVKGQTGSEE